MINGVSEKNNVSKVEILFFPSYSNPKNGVASDDSLTFCTTQPLSI
jgi:hypothetical protein